ncbi:chemerin-like receptor 1 [Ahaetulla prasina]|uniref:chemerin-like receptor 1 n=1 Tax=Ahaetulla prasina TaxID=499056 RepID=UPI002648DF07|nr:chemerin-like receptor 1 [Ahaetulla prasina]
MSNATYNYELLKKSMQTASMVFCSLALVVGVLGNGLVIFITGFRMKKTVNTVWFFNLAIADIFFIFLLYFARAALIIQSDMSLPLCKANGTLLFFTLFASVYLLMVISIDRCISVWYPVWAQNHRTPRLASFVVLGVWILALVLCSPVLYFWETEVNPIDMARHNCSNVYGEFEVLSDPAMVISRFIFAFVIPFSVILICYGAIVLKLRRTQLSPSSKPYTVITAVIVPFFAFWLPYYVFLFIDMKYGTQLNLQMTLYIGLPLVSCLAFINSCLNPIFYVFMGQNFREALRRSLFSAFEDAFTEDVRQTATANKTNLQQRRNPNDEF